MFRKTLVTLSAGVAFLSSPIVAQETPSADEKQMADVMAAMGDMFTADPLTAEQEQRLPTAIAVVAQIFPEGTYAKLMKQTMEPMFDSMFGVMGDVPLSDLAQLGGMSSDDVENLGDATLNEVTEIYDPAFKERNQIAGKATVEMIAQVVDRIEPSYRAGLARAYATRFTNDELVELERFFSTPVGSHYAAQSMLINADPQVLAAMNEMMPAMMETMPQMIASIEERTAALPKRKKYSDLTVSEQARLAELLGISERQLEANMGADAAAVEAADEVEEMIEE